MYLVKSNLDSSGYFVPVPADGTLGGGTLELTIPTGTWYVDIYAKAADNSISQQTLRVLVGRPALRAVDMSASPVVYSSGRYTMTVNLNVSMRELFMLGLDNGDTFTNELIPLVNVYTVDNIRIGRNTPTGIVEEGMNGYTNTISINYTTASTTEFKQIRLVATNQFGTQTLTLSTVGLDSFVQQLLTANTSATDLKAQIQANAATFTTPVVSIPTLDITSLIQIASLPADVSASIFTNSPVSFIAFVPGSTVSITSAALPTNNLIYFPGNTGDSFTLTVDGVPYVIAFAASSITVAGTPYSPGDYVSFGTKTFRYLANGSATFGQGTSSAGGGSSNVPCFLANAPVLTPTGYQRINSLKEGDMVLTGDGRAVAIQRVKRTLVAAGPAVNPYVIPCGRFGATKRLLISPNHRVQVEGRGMVEARNLGLRQEEKTGSFVYYNLELPEWGRDTMVVAGVVVESLAPVRRVAISMGAFKTLLAHKYGAAAASPEVLQKVLRTCRMLPDGRVEAPVMRNA
jgi:hypothetical protein